MSLAGRSHFLCRSNRLSTTSRWACQLGPPLGLQRSLTTQVKSSPLRNAVTNRLAHYLRQQRAEICVHLPPERYSSSRKPEVQLGAVDPFTLLIATAISAGVTYLATSVFSGSPTLPEVAATKLDCIAADIDMASSTAPGRPGNLTPEQEAKLKDMWGQLLKVFGLVQTPTAPASTDPVHASTADDSGRKKRRGLSIFGGRGKSKDDGDETSDKHGQQKEFETALSSDSPEQLRQAFWDLVKHDNPDAIVLRYLRARKWDTSAAMVMLVSTLHWLLGVDPYNKIVAKGEGHALAQSKSADPKEQKEGQEFMSICHVGKSFIHGHDIVGRPVVYIRTRLHKSGQESDATMERFTIYTIENTRLFLTPVVDTATIVFDMQSFTLANMDYAPVKFMIKCFEANYPESLGAVVVYKAPWVFQGIWKVIKGWLDPVVAGKIHFENDVDGLEKFIGPRSRIMKELNGEEEYEYTYVEPTTDEDVVMKNVQDKEAIQEERKSLQEKFEAVTATWVAPDTKSETGALRSKLSAELTQNYWRLDPYIRARTLYDRIGVLQSGGKVEHYPAQGVEKSEAATSS